MLVNTQPVRQTMAVEARSGSGQCCEAGVIRDDAEIYEDVRSSERTLAELAARGLFVPRARDAYLLEFHFHAADDWRCFLARPRVGKPEVDELILAGAWDDPDGRVVAIDETSIATYDRGNPADPRI